MKGRRSAGSISVPIQPSLLAIGSTTAIAIAAIAAAFFAQLGVYAFTIVVVGVLVAWAVTLHRLNRPRWRKVMVTADGKVVLSGRDGHTETGPLTAPPRRAGPLLSFAIATTAGRTRRVRLFADSAAGDAFRHLSDALEHAAARRR